MYHKVILFISSYIPLYILLILKNVLERTTRDGNFSDLANKIKNAVFFDEINDFAVVILTFLSIYSFWYLKRKIRRANGEKKFIIITIKDETSNNYFNYISVYLLSCMGLSLNSIVDIFVFIFLMVVVGFIYINNNMTYLNPTLNLLGFKIYEMEVESVYTNQRIESIVVSRNSNVIRVNDIVMATGKNGFMYLERKVD